MLFLLVLDDTMLLFLLVDDTSMWSSASHVGDHAGVVH